MRRGRESSFFAPFQLVGVTLERARPEAPKCMCLGVLVLIQHCPQRMSTNACPKPFGLGNMLFLFTLVDVFCFKANTRVTATNASHVTLWALLPNTRFGHFYRLMSFKSFRKVRVSCPVMWNLPSRRVSLFAIAAYCLPDPDWVDRDQLSTQEEGRTPTVQNQFLLCSV